MSINVSMTSPNGVILATNGKYCPDDIKITPVLQEKTVVLSGQQQEIIADSGNVGLSKVIIPTGKTGEVANFKQWTVTIAGCVPSVDGTMLTDSWIAEHYNDADLCLSWSKISGDMSSGSAIGGVLCNSVDIISDQYCGMRSVVERDSTPNPTNLQIRGICYLYITTSGEIKYCNGGSIYFRDGVYVITAWLAKNGQ